MVYGKSQVPDYKTFAFAGVIIVWKIKKAKTWLEENSQTKKNIKFSNIVQVLKKKIYHVKALNFTNCLNGILLLKLSQIGSVQLEIFIPEKHWILRKHAGTELGTKSSSYNAKEKLICQRKKKFQILAIKR